MDDKHINKIESISHETWIKFFRRKMTVGEIESILKVFRNESYFYTSSLKVISKHFLSYVFNENVFNMRFLKLKKTVLIP